MQQIAITTEFIKLDSFLKLAGVADSGGQSKVLIKDGEVLVDGQECTMRGKKLYPGARVQVAGNIYEVVGS
ncbi:MAG: RNA-binding S4 domain-containing protein [Oscillospiraceae bacterium]|nr:RNA-binding S4 domain-containing protein [Oscillospiraceae bacterium]